MAKEMKKTGGRMGHNFNKGRNFLRCIRSFCLKLPPDDHPVTPAGLAHSAHRIELLVQRIHETDHEEPAKVVASLAWGNSGESV